MKPRLKFISGLVLIGASCAIWVNHASKISILNASRASANRMPLASQDSFYLLTTHIKTSCRIPQEKS